MPSDDSAHTGPVRHFFCRSEPYSPLESYAESTKLFSPATVFRSTCIQLTSFKGRYLYRYHLEYADQQRLVLCSPGVVIEVAVGCAISGLVIGPQVFMFLLRRLRKAARHGCFESTPRSKSPDSRAFPAAPREPVAATWGLDQFLSVPKSDKELEGEPQSLGYLIQQHAEDNCHPAPRGRTVGPLG